MARGSMTQLWADAVVAMSVLCVRRVLRGRCDGLTEGTQPSTFPPNPGRNPSMKSKLIAAVVATIAIVPVPSAQAQSFINVLTGGTSGVYYPLGVAIGK